MMVDSIRRGCLVFSPGSAVLELTPDRTFHNFRASKSAARRSWKKKQSSNLLKENCPNDIFGKLYSKSSRWHQKLAGGFKFLTGGFGQSH